LETESNAMLSRLTAVVLLIATLSSLGCSKKPTASELAELNRELHQAVERHDVASARRLLKKGANIESTTYNDMTPLGVAASDDDLPMVQLLLQKGARVHTKDHSLETPLMHAAYGGHTEIVRLLLKQNPDLADKNEALLETAHGEPAIVIVENPTGVGSSGQTFSRRQTKSQLEKPWVETVKLLLDSGADIEARDEYRGPPLVDAASYAQTDVVLLLLDRGANLHARDKYGHTALIAAACECAVATMNDAYDVVKLLLDKGSDVNAHSNDGTTALMNAAGGFGGSSIVKLLLERGAGPRARDSEGNTALKFASERDRKDKVEFIRQALDNSRKR
jgi:ankyrin repeat protein